MNDQTINAIVNEIAPIMTGRLMGKVTQLTPTSLAFDFRLAGGRVLFLSAEPSGPRIYLVNRRVRELESAALAPSNFVLTLRKHLSGAELISLKKDEGDRIVRLSFLARDEVGNSTNQTLVAQLTGKAANLLLIDNEGLVVDTLRRARGEGQNPGERYGPPPPRASEHVSHPVLQQGEFSSLSEAADHYYQKLDSQRAFKMRSASARASLRREITQREKLRQRLSKDLEGHGDAVEHKRLGDLLLANIGTASRHGNVVKLTDYYREGMPTVELEVEENTTLQDEAARYFARYGKARSAATQIASRIATLERELSTLNNRAAELDEIIESGDDATLDNFIGEPKASPAAKRGKKGSNAEVPGARRYRSSDGYEILVGRASRDNDNLTFRVARPQDLWLHSADYPGSHVIIRNPTRADVPHRTIIEAAQLAAAFSQAKRDSRVDVHYTQRKYLSKPKGAAAGLVRMSSFRTIAVEPGENIERILK